MAKRSISDCRWAIQIARGRDMTTLGMTVTLGGEQMLITDLRVIDKQWVSGDRRFTPREKELLTKQARAIIAEDEAFRGRFRTPPVISIKECQEAIAIAGGIPITLRGENVHHRTQNPSDEQVGERRQALYAQGEGTSNEAGESHHCGTRLSACPSRIDPERSDGFQGAPLIGGRSSSSLSRGTLLHGSSRRMPYHRVFQHRG